MAAILNSVGEETEAQRSSETQDRGHRKYGAQPGVRGLGHLSGRGNTTAEDKMEGSADRRETNKSLIRLEHKVLGGEMMRGRGRGRKTH